MRGLRTLGALPADLRYAADVVRLVECFIPSLFVEMQMCGVGTVGEFLHFARCAAAGRALFPTLRAMRRRGLCFPPLCNPCGHTSRDSMESRVVRPRGSLFHGIANCVGLTAAYSVESRVVRRLFHGIASRVVFYTQIASCAALTGGHSMELRPVGHSLPHSSQSGGIRLASEPHSSGTPLQTCDAITPRRPTSALISGCHSIRSLH